MKHLKLFEKFTNEGTRKDYSRKDFTKYPYQMYFTVVGISDAVGANSVKELIEHVAKKRGLKSFSIYKSRFNGKEFHNTTDEDFLVAWYDEKDNDFWSNRSKKEPELLKKRMKTIDDKIE